MDKLTLKLNTGVTLNLNPVKAQNGNTYWSVTKNGKAPTKFGMAVDPSVIGSKLPTEVQVFQGTKALTPKLRTVKGQSMGGNPKVTADSDVTINGERKKFTFNVSQTPSGFSINSARINGAGGNGRRAVSSLD